MAATTTSGKILLDVPSIFSSLVNQGLFFFERIMGLFLAMLLDGLDGLATSTTNI